MIRIDASHSYAALLCAGLLLAGCEPTPSEAPKGASSAGPQAAGAPSESEVLATVNGQALTRDDLAEVIKRNPRTRGRKLSARQQRNLLEAMVGQEVFAQRAAELGLESAPPVRRKLAEKQAELDNLRRRLLAKQLVAHLSTKEITVTDAEVRTYYEDNKAQVAYRFHVHQILRRRPDKIEAVRRRLEAGESFETIAAEGLPPQANAADRKPWDLGPLRWTQLPDPWRPVLAQLEVGQVSKVVSTDRRHWILKLVAKERDPEATYEFLEPTLRTALIRARTEERRKKTEKALRESAKIVFSDEPEPSGGAPSKP